MRTKSKEIDQAKANTSTTLVEVDNNIYLTQSEKGVQDIQQDKNEQDKEMSSSEKEEESNDKSSKGIVSDLL